MPNYPPTSLTTNNPDSNTTKVISEEIYKEISESFPSAGISNGTSENFPALGISDEISRIISDAIPDAIFEALSNAISGTGYDSTPIDTPSTIIDTSSSPSEVPIDIDTDALRRERQQYPIVTFTFTPTPPTTLPSPTVPDIAPPTIAAKQETSITPLQRTKNLTKTHPHNPMNRPSLFLSSGLILTNSSSNKRARTQPASQDSSGVSQGADAQARIEKAGASVDEETKDKIIERLQAEVKRLEQVCRGQYNPPLFEVPTWNVKYDFFFFFLFLFLSFSSFFSPSRFLFLISPSSLCTSLWDASTGILLDCNRSFYLHYRPKVSPCLPSPLSPPISHSLPTRPPPSSIIDNIFSTVFV
jgi:hypothetical protein